jgi:hypothetical protein
VHAVFRGFQASGASLSGALVVTDAGATACHLDGAPQSVTLLDDSGTALAVKVRALDLPPNGGPVELQPGVAMPTFGAPPVHGSAWVSLTWSNWCKTALPAVRSMLVVLPAGGSVAAPLDTAIPSWAVGPPAPQCSVPSAASLLSYGRFQAAA